MSFLTPLRGALSVLALAVCLWFLHSCSVTRAYGRGYAAAETNAAAIVATADQRRIEAEALLALTQADVDTVFVTVKARAERVQNIGNRIHDTVRVAFPVVDTLVTESAALAEAVDTLHRTVLTERAAATALHTVDTTTIHAQAVVIGAKSDSVRTLKKRPTRTRATIVALVVGGVSFLLGRR